MCCKFKQNHPELCNYCPNVLPSSTLFHTLAGMGKVDFIAITLSFKYL